MKRCDYCGKEISYNEQYCSNECEEQALKHYELEQRYKNVFGFFNVLCTVSTLVSCFLGLLTLTKPAFLCAGISLSVLGIVIFLIPLPVENLIKKYKLKKAISITKAIATAILVLGIFLLIIFFIKY